MYDKIKVQFDCSAFVPVSRDPNIRNIFKKILYDLDKQKYGNINEAIRDEKQLIDELRCFLSNKGKHHHMLADPFSLVKRHMCYFATNFKCLVLHFRKVAFRLVASF